MTEDAILPDEPPFDVWLDVSVTGQGRIQSTNAGLNPPIDCGDGHSRCGGDYGYGLTINLRAVPAAGHHFVRWEGDCSDTSPECSVDMVHEDKIVDAVFAADGPPPPPPRPNLRVLSVNMDCPTPASSGCATWRLDMMGQVIASAAPDILLVRELFWGESANILVNAVRSHGHPLNYVEVRPGGERLLNGRGGTLIATKDLEISDVTSYIFDSHVLPDSLVNKGVIHLRVKLGHRDGQPVFLRVANTHLQSFFLDWHNNANRRQQIGEMRRYINRAHPYPNAEPLLLGGDFNVAQYGWASDITTWNLLYGTMQLWNMDSVQKMCGDRGESGCTGAATAADNFLGSVLQIFATKPNSYEARMAAYNLIPTRYSSTYLPTLTDHPIKVVDFAYQEIPRTQPACTTYEVNGSEATCPAGTYLAGAGGGPWCDDDGSRNCHVQQVGGTMSTSFTTVQWSPLSCYAPLGCTTWPSYAGTSVTCCGFRNRTPAEEQRATE